MVRVVRAGPTPWGRWPLVLVPLVASLGRLGRFGRRCIRRCVGAFRDGIFVGLFDGLVGGLGDDFLDALGDRFVGAFVDGLGRDLAERALGGQLLGRLSG